MASRLRRLLPPTPELHKAVWLAAVLSAITCSYTLVKVARDALFLSRLPAQQLPYVYVLVGVLTLGVSWVFGRLTRGVSPLRALIGSALVSGLVLVVFALGFTSSRGWLPVAFYVWVNLYGLILTSQFWAFTNTRSDPSEAKRIFGIVGGGGIVGGLAGGWVAARLGHRVPLQGLALVGAGLLLVMSAAMIVAVRQGHVSQVEEAPPEKSSDTPLHRVPYVRWLALAALCSVIVTGLVDYQFKVVAQTRYADAAGLATFFGRIFVWVNIAAIVIQLAGTRWLLQRFGAGTAAALLPAGLAITATVTILSPRMRWVVTSRIWDQTLRFSLNKSATEMFYFPLDVGLRRRAKALIEAGIERFGDGLAGLIIAATSLFFVVGPATLSSIIAIVVVVWLVAWAWISRAYVRELGRSLRRMNPDANQERVSLRESGVLKELVRALDNPHERVVLQAIELLLESAPPLLDTRLPKLLEHRSPRIRARALERVREAPTRATLEIVERRIHDPDPRVRLEAMRIHCALDGSSVKGLEEYLDAENPELRATAMVCLVEHAPPAEGERVRVRLEAGTRSASAVERAAAAEAIGTPRAPAELLALLVPLFDDPDFAVRRAALLSVGRARWTDHLPTLMRALGSRDTEVAAREGLLAFGSPIVPVLGDWLADTRLPLEIRRVVPKVLAEIPNQEAMDALFAVEGGFDVVLDYRILKAANQIRISNANVQVPTAQVERNLDREVREILATELHADSQGQPGDQADQFLVRVLRERRDQAFNRMFRHLALLFAPRAMYAAYTALRSQNLKARGSAEEFVSSTVSAEQRPWIQPLLPGGTREQRLELAESRYQLVPLERHASLAALLESPDQWVRSCAIYVAVRRQEQALASLVKKALDARDPRVRETAEWAMQALAGAAP